jgi:hypothetical protein
MDPRISMSAAALQRQYELARDVTDVMNRSYRDEAAARKAGRGAAADAYGTINDNGASLLDAIDGADAPPTAAATDAVAQLRTRLQQVQAHPPETPPNK